MWRPALPADDTAIQSLAAALYREDPSPYQVDAAHTLVTLARLRAEPVRGLAMVLEVAGKAQGYAFLVSYWSNERGGEVCFLDEIYVAPELRGQGHGRLLIEALKGPESPWPGKAIAIDLEVSPKNTRARALYEKLGFTVARNSMLRLPLGD